MVVTMSPSLESAVRRIDACRSCGSPLLEEVLNLGEHYVSDFVEGDGGHKAPLELVRCAECTLVQLRHTVPSAWHYEHGYWYQSGTNEQMVAQLKDVVDNTRGRIVLFPYELVVDVGCNDGTLLRMWPKATRRVGFEPAINLRELAETGENLIYSWPFPPPKEISLRLSRSGSTLLMHHGPAKVITAIAMFYDLDDPNVFVEAVGEWLHVQEGLFVIQMAYAPAMLATNDIGNVSHEHLEYYTVKSLAHLLNRHGLMIEDVSFNDVNGGSFRVFVRHGTGGITNDPPNTQLDWGAFADRVLVNRDFVRGLLARFKSEERTIAGYGASTRGNTCLQYWGIGPDLLPFIVDRNPAKWGKRTVGTGIPIVSEDEMHKRKPDYLFVLPWHLIESFKQREPEYAGRWIVPLPSLHLA